jgi:hypothetical protein
MEVMARHSVRGTAALNSEVCDDYPQVIEDAVKLGWEFMGHNQSNARHLHLMSPESVVFLTSPFVYVTFCTLSACPNEEGDS